MIFLVHIPFDSIAPLMPTGFNITDVDYSQAILVTFDWDPPNGTGTQTIVETYHFVVTPKPIQPISNTSTSPISIFLSYNVKYSVHIFAVNCAGDSEAATISNISYGN